MTSRLTSLNKDFLDRYRTDPERDQVKAYQATYPKASVKTAEVNACKILKKPEAIKYLEKKAAKAQKALDLTEESILRDIITLKDMCMGREAVAFAQLSKDGDIIEGTVLQFNANGAKGALELLGKNKKMFTDKVEASGNMNVSFNFNLAGKGR